MDNTDVNRKSIDDCLADDIKSLQGDVYYLPNGGNLGDLAIAYSEFQFFDELGFRPKQITRNSKDQVSKKPFSLVYGGGGIWTGLYNTQYAESLFNSRNLKKCVVMPSTFYNSKQAIDAFDERFTVYCRDESSFRYCAALNKTAKFKMHHDLALCADIRGLNYKDVRNVKTDQAKKASDAINQYLRKNTGARANFMRSDAEKTDRSGGFDLSKTLIVNGLSITRQLAEDGMRIALYAINKYGTIETNRLHVAILAYRLNKKILLYGNSYGKTLNVCRYSIQDYAGLQFMDDNKAPPAKRLETDVFENSFVISASEERLADFKKSMKAVCPNASVWHAVYFKKMVNSVPKLEYGVIGCSASHLSLVQMAEFNGYDCVCIFEDDACPSKNFSTSLLKEYLARVPEDCDVLLLGTLMQTGKVDENYLRRVTNAFGSHAYVIFKRAYAKYRRCVRETTYVADHIFRHLTTYAITPSMFDQKNYAEQMHHDQYHRDPQSKKADPKKKAVKPSKTPRRFVFAIG